MFESEAFLRDVLRGQLPEQAVVDAVTRSYLRHLYVATPCIFTNTWSTLNPLPDGITAPTSRNASTPVQLHGWDSLVPWPRGRRGTVSSLSPRACQEMIELVCEALDAPFSELPQGDDLSGILAGACWGRELPPQMWAGAWCEGVEEAVVGRQASLVAQAYLLRLGLPPQPPSCRRPGPGDA